MNHPLLGLEIRVGMQKDQTTKNDRYVVLLPDGRPIHATEADDAQTAMARAMMMDVPHGCEVVKMAS